MGYIYYFPKLIEMPQIEIKKPSVKTELNNETLSLSNVLAWEGKYVEIDYSANSKGRKYELIIYNLNDEYKGYFGIDDYGPFIAVNIIAKENGDKMDIIFESFRIKYEGNDSKYKEFKEGDILFSIKKVEYVKVDTEVPIIWGKMNEKIEKFEFYKEKILPIIKTYSVEKFSEDYYVKVLVEDQQSFVINSGDENIFHSDGWYLIYDKNNKEKLRVEFPQYRVGITNNSKTNILELPYGEMSAIIYDDFNLDGIKDFALQDGRDSCYGGPSYDIYLAKNSEFIMSDDFSKLAHEYCGMFNVDKDKKMIYAFTKSGCCMHWYDEFIIENNSPKKVRETFVGPDEKGQGYYETVKELINGEWKVMSKTPVQP